MEDNQTNTSKQGGEGNSNKWIIITAAVIIIMVIAAAGGFFFLNSDQDNEDDVVIESENTGEDAMVQNEGEGVVKNTASYSDGTFTATGTYSYHSGTESIEVTLTLESGVITEAQVVSQAVASVSKTMQADFINNFKSEVVGKNIDEVKVGKISGSSLTGIGFNAAVEGIKAQASAS